jgi:hypothetical protein
MGMGPNKPTWYLVRASFKYCLGWVASVLVVLHDSPKLFDHNRCKTETSSYSYMAITRQVMHYQFITTIAARTQLKGVTLQHSKV